MSQNTRRNSLLSLLVLIALPYACSGAPTPAPEPALQAITAPTQTSGIILAPTLLPTQTSGITLGPTLPPTQTPSATDTPSGPVICWPRYAPGQLVAQVASSGYLDDMAAADFNADGLTDVLLTRAQYQTAETFELELLLNDGTRTFKRGASTVFDGPVPKVQHPREMILADFNGDGRMDIFVADHGQDVDPWPGYQNTLALSEPGGKLIDATANLPQQSDFTHSATAADIDGDRDLDIYVGNIFGGKRIPPQIWLNDGTGHFRVARGLLPSAQTNLDLNKYTTSLFVDVKGDGYADLFLGADDSTRTSLMLLNDGTGHFVVLLKAMPPKPMAPTDIALDSKAADINGDGYQDLLVVYTKGEPAYVGWYIQVLINRGDGMFSDETANRLPQSPGDGAWMRWVDLVDLDHDGDFDLVGHTDEPITFANDGNGVFNTQLLGFALVEAGPFVVLDADGDGNWDILSSGSSSPRYYLYRNIGCQ